MLLKGEQLAAHLERELRPLYVLYGDEPLLVIEAADAIRAKARQQALRGCKTVAFLDPEAAHAGEHRYAASLCTG